MNIIEVIDEGIKAAAVGRNDEAIRALKVAKREIELLSGELSVAEKFHKVAVAERDYERAKVQQLLREKGQWK